jgi:argininosuccinate lyase
MKQASQRTWGGRFSTGPAEAVKKFTESVSFDWRLYKHDIAGSIAHAKGLAKAGIITKAEAGKIERGLRAIQKTIEKDGFQWNPSLEDVHMNIETALVKKIGAAGKKLHTARSRNDQVATDLRLWMNGAAEQVSAAIANLQESLVTIAEANTDVVIPGYTHTQRAQPVLLAHHLMAYVEMLARDARRFVISMECPLGSGAIAGSTLSLVRESVAKELGFAGVTQNSMDAVSDRDFVLDFLYACAVTGMHLSRLAEDLILWSTAEFGFITIGDAYTTGSSLMPQKKNPDICELVRGKTGRLYGNLVAVLTMMKGLPMTYNRDMQEDKEPLFDSADTLLASLNVMADMLRHTKVNRARCEAAASDPMLLATDLVDFLVNKGTPFREAHHIVGALVAESEKTGVPLPQVAGKKYGRAAEKVFDVRRALDARKAVGAPSPKNVRNQIARWKKALAGIAVAAIISLTGRADAQTATNAPGHQLAFCIANSNPAIVFNDVQKGGLKFVRANGWDGASWGQPVVVDSSPSAGSAISVARVLGNPAICYQDGGQLKYVRANDMSGIHWSQPVVVDGNGVGTFVSLGEVNGYASVAYSDLANGALKFAQANNSSGSSWKRPVVVDNRVQLAMNPSLATVEYAPAVAYFDHASGTLRYSRANTALGRNWVRPLSVNPSAGTGIGPSLIMMGISPAVSFYSATSRGVIFVQAEDNLGMTWPQATGVALAETSNTSLAMVHDNPAIAYFDQTDSTVKYVRANDSNGTAWSAPVAVDSSGQGAAAVALLMVDGRPAVAYWLRTSDGAQVRFTRAQDYNGTQWMPPVTVWSSGQ